jgi:hypothetical protein
MGLVSTQEDREKRRDADAHEGASRRVTKTFKGVRTPTGGDGPEIVGGPASPGWAAMSEVRKLRQENARLTAENAKLRAQLKEKSWRLRSYRKKSVRTVGRPRFIRPE